MKSGSNIRNREFYSEKRVFVTGHTGYKGSWLTAVLRELGADATGYGLPAPEGGLFRSMGGERLLHHVEGDLLDFEHLKRTLLVARPEIVLHLSALVTVSACFASPRQAYETNVMGLVNLLEAVRYCPEVKSVVIITTDKVYENKGDGAVYRETDPLGASDPLSGSKTCMEYVAQSFKRAFLQVPERTVGIATVRASNVLGGGDHDLTRLVPSILDSISRGKAVELRNPHQTRPWQSMLDALNGYLTLGRLMYMEPEKFSGPWNIGPTRDGIREVLWVVEKMKEYYSEAEYKVGGTLPAAESKTLGLDIGKALEGLDWEPLLSCDRMIYNVVEFHKQQRAGVPELEILQKQIREFFKIA